MNVYDMFWRERTSDNERRWRRFELYECFLVQRVLPVISWSFRPPLESLKLLKCLPRCRLFSVRTIGSGIGSGTVPD